MGTVQIVQEAPARHQFAPDSFDNQVGRMVPLEAEGQSIGNCKIVGAEVSSDGTEARLTLEIPDGVIPQGSSLSGLSIADDGQ
jgi:hypothetical protein